MRCHATRVLVVVAALTIAGPCARATAGDAPLATVATLSVDLLQTGGESEAGPAGTPAARPATPDEWWCNLDLTLWLPGLNGTIGVGPITADVDVSFLDVVDNASSVIGLAGAIRLGKGRFGGYLDGFWSRLGVDVTTPFGTASATTEMGIVDVGVSCEIGRWPMEWTATDTEPARDMVLTARGGMRWTTLDQQMDFAVLPSVGGDKSWVDPMLGATVELPLAQHLSLGLRGDIGGFGAASDLAWTAMGVLSWDFRMGKLPSSLQCGYIAIGDDYSTGSGLKRFEWDTILHGMVLNFSMHF